MRTRARLLLPGLGDREREKYEAVPLGRLPADIW